MNISRTGVCVLAAISLSIAVLGCASDEAKPAAKSDAGGEAKPAAPPRPAPSPLAALPREERVDWVKRHYTKREYRVPVRDGVYLFTSVYTPKDASAKKTYPILLCRTPYSCSPYGEDKFSENPGPAGYHYLEGGYIFVKQDVRGRYMSEGIFEDMRPHNDHKGAPEASAGGEYTIKTRAINGELPPPMAIDEASDTYDSIDWLVKNLPGNNGRVGLWGISYPGFYCSAGMIDHHPALVAVAPMAPIADWAFDDFFHHGAFFLPHNFNFFSGFGKARPTLSTGGGNPGDRLEHGTPDGYQFFLDLGPLTNVNEKYYKHTVRFWDVICEHPNYDEFWQARNILPHLHNIAPNVMVVGGWFDAEDLYGAVNTYKSANALNPQAGPGLTREAGAQAGAVNTTFVMGPWFHGGWHRSNGDFLGNVSFDMDASVFYQDAIEFPWFNHCLKDAPGTPAPNLAEAYAFETGANNWRRFDQWPPAGENKTLWFGANGSLGFERKEASGAEAAFDEYTTDPAKPAPFIEEVNIGMTRQYMTDDQRFAARRPDVLVYQTEPLKEDVTLAGPVLADLWVSIAAESSLGVTKLDSDFVVKLIDVFPKDFKDNEHTRAGVRMANYEMLVRSEIMRGRFRNSYSNPEPFSANEPSRVALPLQDLLHTFQKGHRIMVQVQSAWFPLIDRNPQKYVDNIFKAKAEDFIRATQRVYRTGDRASGLKVTVLPKDALEKAAVPEAEAYRIAPPEEPKDAAARPRTR